MPKWSEYTKKNQPSDNDIMMIEDKDANVNKLLTFSGLSDWIIEKLKKNNVISGALKFKGSSAYASLPTNPEQNDYYYSPDGNGTDGAGYYAWDGTAWIFIGNNDKGVDSTFTVEGAAVDSKAVGDKFSKVDSETASLKEDIVPLEYDIYNQLNNINLDEWKTNNPNNTISEDNGVLSVIMNIYAEDFRIQRIGAISNFQTGHIYYAKCEMYTENFTALGKIYIGDSYSPVTTITPSTWYTVSGLSFDFIER
jgi:hypothetical protein